jgi:WD40 repeat protein
MVILLHQGVPSGELGPTEDTSARFKHALERGDLPTQTQTAYKLALINGHASWITIDETEHRSESRWQDPTVSKAAASLPAHRERPYRDTAEETLPDPIEEVSGEQGSSAIKYLATLEGHTEGATAIDFSPDGRSALSGSWDKTLRLWDLETQQCRAILTGHTEGVAAVGFSPDGQRALSGIWDKTLRLWG